MLAVAVWEAVVAFVIITPCHSQVGSSQDYSCFFAVTRYMYYKFAGGDDDDVLAPRRACNASEGELGGDEVELLLLLVGGSFDSFCVQMFGETMVISSSMA